MHKQSVFWMSSLMIDLRHFPFSATLRVGLIATVIFALSHVSVHARSPKFNSYDDFSKSNIPRTILWNVIARKGKSKNYEQVFRLDGGTVGIANFAVGGLASLYRFMDTEKYFSRSREEMIRDYSAACRPRGYRGNDSGWGCYSKKWWRDGMRRFVVSSNAKEVQDRAWLSQMRPTIELAIKNGWTTSRSLAIAAGVANSMGGGGFRRLASACNWQSERVLSRYVGTNAHRQRRQTALNLAFPL